MSPEPSTYHQRVAAHKRAEITGAATRLFLDAGYDRTSLAKVADAAGVSKATLFKQFPTKAALFDAIVTEAWSEDDATFTNPPTGDVVAGLTAIGLQYAALLVRPTMVALFRIVIAELPRFPELGRAHFERGKMPYFDSVRHYLDAECAAGTVDMADSELATTQFLGMVSNFVFWPKMLLTDWTPSQDSIAHTVAEAALTMHARYAPPRDSTRPGS